MNYAGLRKTRKPTNAASISRMSQNLISITKWSCDARFFLVVALSLASMSALILCLDLSFSYFLDLMTFKKDTITFSSNMIYGPLRVAWRVIYVYTTDFDRDTDKLMGL